MPLACHDVIEHIQRDDLALVNMAQALEPGGSLVLTVPQHRWLWSPVDALSGHQRRYRRQELVDRVQAAGLEVRYVTSFVSLLLPLMWLSRHRSSGDAVDAMAEFTIPAPVNAALEAVMRLEEALLRLGLRFPAGGSLLLVARRP